MRKRIKRYDWGDYYATPNTKPLTEVEIKNPMASYTPRPTGGAASPGSGLDNSAEAGSNGMGSNIPYQALGNLGAQGVDMIDKPNKHNVRTGGGAFASGALKGAGTGAAMGSVAGPMGTAVGAIAGTVIGGASGMMQNSKAIDAQEKALNEKEARLIKTSQSRLANYPIFGIPEGAFGMKFPNGGRLPYPTDGSDYRALSSDMAQYYGDTHANGGIKLDTNSDNNTDIEIENKEVIKDNMVLSNRLYPSGNIAPRLQELRINSNKTIAEAAADIGKKKGKFEKKLDSASLAERNTGKIMVERLDNLANQLFEDQQNQNGDGDMNRNNYAYGGYASVFEDPNKPPVKKTDPGLIGPQYNKVSPNTTAEQKRIAAQINLTKATQFKNKLTGVNNSYFPSADDELIKQGGGYGSSYQNVGGGKRKYTFVDPKLVHQADSVINASRPLVYPKKFAYGDEIDTSALSGARVRTPLALRKDLQDYQPRNSFEYAVGSPMFTSPPIAPGFQTQQASNHQFNTNALTAQANPNIVPVNLPQQNSPQVIGNTTIPNTSVEANSGGPTLRKLDIGDYYGDIAAGAGFLANAAQISRLETEVNPELVDAPINNYTSRMPQLRRAVETQFRTASRGINGSSAQDNNAVKANLYAKSLDALNAGVDSEIQRKDSFDNRFNELSNRNNIINAQLTNHARNASMDNRNQRKALVQQNIDSLIRSEMGNKTQRDLQETDFVKSYLEYAKQGDTGVADRLINQLPRRTRRRIGFA